MQFTSAAVVCLLLASSVHSIQLRNGHSAGNGTAPATCGTLPSLPNAKPASSASAQGKAFNSATGQIEDVAFVAGDEIEFKCERGYTTDASPSGNNTFSVTCTEHGYYQPQGACLAASKCGALPEIAHAYATGKAGVAPGSVEMNCQVGYSLDGKKVVAGGAASNRYFVVRCQEFGAWERFEGECKPYAFMPSGEANAIYTKVFDALFKVSCKSDLKKELEAGRSAPTTEVMCGGFEDASMTQQCQVLVGQLQADFAAVQSARQEYTADPTRTDLNTDIDEEAEVFCREMWSMMGH